MLVASKHLFDIARNSQRLCVQQVVKLSTDTESEEDESNYTGGPFNTAATEEEALELLRNALAK